jgi:hypothetical protein
MTSKSGIVQFGGWIEREVKIRPRTNLCFNVAKHLGIIAFLSVFYIIIFGDLEFEVPWPVWLAWGLIALEALVIVVAVISMLHEEPKDILVQEKNTDVDPRNLY